MSMGTGGRGTVHRALCTVHRNVTTRRLRRARAAQRPGTIDSRSRTAFSLGARGQTRTTVVSAFRRTRRPAQSGRLVRLTASAKATAVRRSFTRRRKPDTTEFHHGLLCLRPNFSRIPTGVRQSLLCNRPSSTDVGCALSARADSRVEARKAGWLPAVSKPAHSALARPAARRPMRHRSA